MKTTPPQRICIFLSGALGDFILCLPALSTLRRAFPSSRIDLAGNPVWLSLALQSGHVDETFSLEHLSLHAAFQESFSRDHFLFRFLENYDLILSWFGDKEGRWGKALERACPGKVWVRPFHLHPSFPGHVSGYYLNTLKEMGLQSPTSSADPLWPPSFLWNPDFSPGVPEGGSEKKGPCPGLCMHPGSGSRKKNWPKENFLEVAVAAHQRWKLPVTILLGEAEGEQQDFWRSTGSGFVSVRSGLPLPEVCRILARSLLYVGNDSGITHLSASLGVPTVSLFGPTDPARFAPPGPHVRILTEERTCTPCSLQASHNGEPLRGLTQISTLQVLRVLEDLLSSGKRISSRNTTG